MFSSLSRRRVILLVVLTCMLLITLDKHGNPVIDRARSLVDRVLQPIDTATKAITLPVERAWNGVTNYDDLERQNEVLRDQIEHMRGNDVESRSAVLEYRELLKLNQLASKFRYPTVAAQVVGDSPSNFQNTLQINVGSQQGVAVGMPVTDGAGLIGRITKVYPTQSLVLLITDPEYAIAAQVLTAPDEPGTTVPTGSTTPSGIPATGDTGSSTPVGDTTTSTSSPLEVVRETGMLQGQGADKPLLLRFVDTSASGTSVRVGAVVDTAGGNNGLAPQGIPIGIITKVERQTGSSSALVEVTPNASLKRLNFVAVVLYVPNTDAIGR